MAWEDLNPHLGKVSKSTGYSRVWVRMEELWSQRVSYGSGASQCSLVMAIFPYKGQGWGSGPCCQLFLFFIQCLSNVKGFGNVGVML